MFYFPLTLGNSQIITQQSCHVTLPISWNQHLASTLLDEASMPCLISNTSSYPSKDINLSAEDPELEFSEKLEAQPILGATLNEKESAISRTYLVDASTASTYPMVKLDTEKITDATAGRLATSFLGHVLFLKNQIPL